MALAAAASHATAVPVTLARRATPLVAMVMALGSNFFGAQRQTLPFGLKAGHHAVRGEPARWTPQDSGAYPVVIVASGGPAALATVLPQYLASHGYTVVRAPGTGTAAALRQVGNSTPVAILTWEPDDAATATVEIPRMDSSAVRLAIRLVRPVDPKLGKLRVVLPAAGAETRGYRPLCAVTQAILNAALEAAHPTLAELADRLRAAGLRETYIRAS